jgi:hypothetical protein
VTFQERRSYPDILRRAEILLSMNVAPFVLPE